MSKICPELTPLWDEGDAALCSPVVGGREREVFEPRGDRRSLLFTLPWWHLESFSPCLSDVLALLQSPGLVLQNFSVLLQYSICTVCMHIQNCTLAESTVVMKDGGHCHGH
jgi:hypothetical protein